MRNERNSSKGFTIIELLTVMSVIAILIGLLVPALNLVHDLADEVQQQAQFHGIEVAIEMFKTEYGFYPPSSDNGVVYNNAVDTTSYGGAQKLAEALVGWDLVGFHPRSDFRSDGTFTHVDNDGVTLIPAGEAYHLGRDYRASTDSFYESAEENIKARTPFMELENANAYKMEDVYGSGNFTATVPSNPDYVYDALSFVICDEYAKKRATGKKTGMPILYWRANTEMTLQDSSTDNSSSGYLTDDDIYNFSDNAGMLNLTTAEQDTTTERMNTHSEFDDAIANENVTSTVAGFIRPYRAGSYILISAGKDGYYGTADDIANFDKSE
jgi:prepilin-type N-terminal cleavage/methylation domain-containing protein